MVGSYDTTLYMKEQLDVMKGRNEELRAALRETRIECNKLLLERDKAFEKVSFVLFVFIVCFLAFIHMSCFCTK